MTAIPMLPNEFAALEPFAPKWYLATETERYAMRLSTRRGVPRVRPRTGHLIGTTARPSPGPGSTIYYHP